MLEDNSLKIEDPVLSICKIRNKGEICPAEKDKVLRDEITVTYVDTSGYFGRCKASGMISSYGLVRLRRSPGS
mgnify:CR=1 FL=1